MKKARAFFLSLILLVGCSSAQRGSLEFQKDNNLVVKKYILEDPPLVGTTPAGQRIYLGGFSGLRYLGRSAKGNLRFLTHTDRGPNAKEILEDGKTKRPFLLPSFQPRILFLELNQENKKLTLEKEIPLFRHDGKSITGLPQNSRQEIPIDSVGAPLEFDPYGFDLEEIDVADDGSFWMVEEYGPSVVHFSSSGKLLDFLKPGKGLPSVLEARDLNRGFEAGALMGNRMYIMLQSPLPTGGPDKGGRKSRFMRILEVDILKKRTLGQYAYILDSTEADKIGAIAVLGPRRLLVVERDGNTGRKSFKRVYMVSLEESTNLQLLSDKLVGDPGALESLSLDELKAKGIQTAKKEKYLDLAALGIEEEKVEGFTLVSEDTFALVLDNDFGLDGAIDRSTGKIKMNPPESYLYLLEGVPWIPVP